MLLANNRLIRDFTSPYVIAEMNTSHFGSVENAIKMIDLAKEAGCDSAKFQSWSETTLYSNSYYQINPIAKRFVSKFSFDENQLLQLAEHCRKTKIDFASTPYSSTEADFLIEKCHVPYIKVASMELDNIFYLEYLAKRNYPTILSTGMGTIQEIEIAVEILKSYGNKNLCILHCVSLYPTKAELVALQNILNLRQKFPEFSIGFSDHSEGFEFAIAATALGASVIEKHFTIDKSKIGMDNQMATEFHEMSMLVSATKKVSVGLGTHERRLSEEEFNKRKEMRRSFITKTEIAQNTEITMEMLDLKRPGSGFRPNEFSKIIGKRAKRNLEKDIIITEADLE